MSTIRDSRNSRLLSLVGVILFAMAFGSTEPLNAQTSSQPSPCRKQTYDGSVFVICKFNVRKNNITIRWKGSDGKPMGSLEAIRQEVKQSGQELVFAMNGGMYDTDLSPVGYYVEDGKRLKRVNARRGRGNFHMLPNGIFYIDKNAAGVMETRAFLRRNQRPQFATQSGPMLVINGRIHPRFKATSNSKKRRNGVGVSKDGRQVFFAISDEKVTFYAFAELFQLKLETPNALYLDGGTVPQMVSDNISRPSFFPLGPAVVVTRMRP